MLSSLLASARQTLRSFGVVNPDVEAETIFSHVLGLRRTRLYIESERELTAEDQARIGKIVGERRRRFPLQYLLGEVEFMGLPLAMRQGVFIPRPETEILVETVIGRMGPRQAEGLRSVLKVTPANRPFLGPRDRATDSAVGRRGRGADAEAHVVLSRSAAPDRASRLGEAGGADGGPPASAARASTLGVVGDRTRRTRGPRAGRPLRVLDLATGSGAIAVSLAKYLAPEIVVATDISEAAAALARENAAGNGVSDLVAVVVADGLAALRRADGGGEVGDTRRGAGFDLVVCNPPYVATGEIEGLQPEVRDYEPRAALDGGRSGLSFYAGVLRDLPSILRGDGVVAFEIGTAQAVEVSAMFESAGLGPVEVIRDLAGRDRIVLGARR